MAAICHHAMPAKSFIMHKRCTCFDFWDTKWWLKLMLKKFEGNQSLLLPFFKNFPSCIKSLATSFTCHGFFLGKK